MWGPEPQEAFICSCRGESNGKISEQSGGSMLWERRASHDMCRSWELLRQGLTAVPFFSGPFLEEVILFTVCLNRGRDWV